MYPSEELTGILKKHFNERYEIVEDLTFHFKKYEPRCEKTGLRDF